MSSNIQYATRKPGVDYHSRNLSANGKVGTSECREKVQEQTKTYERERLPLLDIGHWSNHVFGAVAHLGKQLLKT